MAQTTSTHEEIARKERVAPQSAPIHPGLRRPLRLLVPTLVLIVYWTVTEASYRIEMGMFYRFVARMVVLFATLLYFLGWGFTRRHFTFGQRWLAFVLITGTMIVAGGLSHPATGTMATGMIGLPVVLTLSVGWLWFARHRGARAELTGIGAVSVLVFGVIALLRWDGMDGRQRAELSWRWTPSAEERFLKPGVLRTSIPTDEQRPILEETTDDWNSFLGGDREGVVRGIELGDWAKSPPREVWRQRVGPAWSSVISIGDYLFTQEQRSDREAVICYRADTGQEVWVHTPRDSSDRFDDSLSGTGPRATCAFHRGRIYAYGAKGRLECLDATTGVAYWSQALFTMVGVKPPQWGSATSPTIVDDKVVVFTGGQQDNSLLALDLLTGKRRWQAAGGPTSYSSPQVMTIAGERLIVMHDDEGLNGIRIDDGKRLFQHQSPHATSFQPMLQPHLIVENRLIVNWDSGLLCLQILREGENWKLHELWTSNRLKPSFNEFAIHKEYIYGLDDGILCCLDLVNGKRIWKAGRYGFGQLLLLPEIDELVVLTEQGDVVRVAADPKGHIELGQFKAVEGKTWNHPLIARGRLVVRNAEEMACFELVKPVFVSGGDRRIRENLTGR